MTDFRLKTPVRIPVCGPSQVKSFYSGFCDFCIAFLLQVGKSFFVAELLKNQNKIFDKPFERIIWCYGINQPEFFDNMMRKIPGLEFVAGFPEQKIEADTLVNHGEHVCLVIGKFTHFMKFIL